MQEAPYFLPRFHAGKAKPLITRRFLTKEHTTSVKHGTDYFRLNTGSQIEKSNTMLKPTDYF